MAVPSDTPWRYDVPGTKHHRPRWSWTPERGGSALVGMPAHTAVLLRPAQPPTSSQRHSRRLQHNHPQGWLRGCARTLGSPLNNDPCRPEDLVQATLRMLYAHGNTGSAGASDGVV